MRPRRNVVYHYGRRAEEVQLRNARASGFRNASWRNFPSWADDAVSFKRPADFSRTSTTLEMIYGTSGVIPWPSPFEPRITPGCGPRRAKRHSHRRRDSWIDLATNGAAIPAEYFRESPDSYARRSPQRHKPAQSKSKTPELTQPVAHGKLLYGYASPRKREHQQHVLLSSSKGGQGRVATRETSSKTPDAPLVIQRRAFFLAGLDFWRE